MQALLLRAKSAKYHQVWMVGTRSIRVSFVLFVLLVSMAACTREQELYDHLEANRPALFLPASEEDGFVAFEIEPGTVARSIAEQLAARGLILDADLFEAYVRSMGVAEELKAGTFQLRLNMTPVEIAAFLLADQAAGVRLTIPEGWRMEQAADLLNETGLVSGANYLELAKMAELSVLGPASSSQTTDLQDGTAACCSPEAERWPFLEARPAGATLEGFLFPATYQLPAVGPTASDLIIRQLDAFGARLAPIYMQASSEGRSLPDLYTALVLASIVEREAVLPLERTAIAGVLLNRLQRGMLLEVDATVQYAMGFQPESGQWWKTPVFLEEYQGVDSPYNTYLYGGTPPGPIASPGEDSFRAVLYADQHDFLYYVATPEGNGAHIFAETFEAHLENVRRYLGR